MCFPRDVLCSEPLTPGRRPLSLACADGAARSQRDCAIWLCHTASSPEHWISPQILCLNHILAALEGISGPIHSSLGLLEAFAAFDIPSFMGF